MDTNGPIRFDDFEFYLGSEQLLRHGQPVKIQPQPLRVLKLLLEHAGRTVTREELRNHIWGGATYVEFDQGLNYCVRQIRVALGDSAANPVFIETLPKQGYRFLPTVIRSNGNGERPVMPAPTDVALDSPMPPISFSGVARSRGWWMVGAAFCGVVAIAAGWLHLARRPHITSLAVLALDNLSGDPGQEYLADGMTEELTTMLAKNSTLRIVSRTSAVQYKSTHRSLREIAAGLGVEGILEGSVARSGNQVHMTIQLIDGRSDTHLWAESFDRDINDSFMLSREVAQSVAKQLGSTVAHQTVTVRSVRPEAHDAYLRGRYLWFTNHNDEAGRYFLKATELQPDYALAWTGVADYYAAGVVDARMNPKDSLLRAKSAALKALSLDHSLAQAHVSFAAVAFFTDWNWTQALDECDRAVELDPKFAEAYHLKAKVLSALNRHEEAIQAERKAMGLNPFARPWGLVLELNWARQFDGAISEARARLESAPTDRFLLWGLAYAYRAKGRDAEAAQTAEDIFQASSNSTLAAETARAFRQGGYRAVVQHLLNLQRTLSRRQYVAPITLANLTAELCERKETLALLEQGFEEHSPLLLKVPFNPAYDFVHGDERYRSLIRKVGLPY